MGFLFGLKGGNAENAVRPGRPGTPSPCAHAFLLSMRAFALVGEDQNRAGSAPWSIFMLACSRSVTSAQRQLPLPVPLILARLLTWVPVDDATSLVPKSDKEASAV
jgi:hypothetical protein